MPDFLRLELGEQADILTAISTRTGRSAQVLQKDVWVCWALRELFSIDAGVRMAFKGGTSLSKVFGLIHRFSEDVDVTLDYRDLIPDANPFEPHVSKSQIKRLSDDLKEHVKAFVHDHIVPTLSASFSDLTGEEGLVEVSEDGEKVWLHYPSPLNRTSGYIRDSVLLEFGGRNVTEPNGPHTIRPFLADAVPELEYPVAEVTVLDPERTFWEKATLVHVECNRQRKGRADRRSRHWYDLVMLGRSEIGREAMSNRPFASRKWLRTNRCSSMRAMRIMGPACPEISDWVPDPALRAELERDYKEMIEAGMFDVDPPMFAEIVDTLEEYEGRINSA